ncbi:hypothetical protein FB45DRAFT_784736, partial [Roridomyces roridus]
MSSHCERVPNELWLDIFQLLPRSSIKHIYATDRKFANASRALLFRHLVFHPYLIRHASWDPGLALPASPLLQIELERLEFWSSDEIALLVRECTVAPRSREETEAEPVPLEDADSPHILMTLFLDRLGKFTGLKKLFASKVKFTQVGLATLCQLPLLTEVGIHRCDTV